MIPVLHGLLDLFAIDRRELAADEDPTLRRSRIDANRLVDEQRRELRAYRECCVEVLAEDNAAVLEPCPAFGAMFSQEVPNRCQLGVSSFGSPEFINDRAQVALLLG